MYAVLLPVKPPAYGKSRLVGLPDPDRRRLAEAFALDTAAACLEAAHVGAVLAITDDARFSSHLTALGCAAIPDGVAGDLNGTLRQGAADARRRWPSLTPVALCGDLPALRADDLDAALSAATEMAPAMRYVADAAGSGTTLFTATHAEFAPRFGTGSREQHELLGAVPIEGGLASLRHDVDDLDDLVAAAALGLGSRTAAVVADLGL
jgi:2-phospho-L-lactate guanylyltransferase